ncbi:MAG: DEAD/DEAH box helicase [Desulfobacterales bacterium]|nr:DEAD/DEAH box helicase [Desulfobacterales bacterium]MCP4161944.1 DEAD/DEAH box helicase [Deltaproteobacteria bacterium]
MTFNNMGLSPSFLKILEAQNYIRPYPIQEEAIPAILNKNDVLGIAKTGSGKTASYVLPVLMNLQKDIVLKSRHVTTLVLVPTRELAVQVNDVFTLFARAMSQKIKSQAVFGGASINPQMKALQNVNVLVATPGRLLELVDVNAVHLSEVKTLVLDEADKILNKGFKKEVNQIIDFLPERRQNLLFSATLNDDISNINQIILHDPIVIKIESQEENIDLITQSAYFIAEEKKGPLLRYLIKSKGMSQVLIFTSSVARADRVADKLRKSGIDAQSIHRRKKQGARTDLLTKFKHDKLRVLVATDLLSRGIDIEFLPYVINYELPRSPKVFVHRIGRTGRAESTGEAISLISPEEEHHFKVIEKKMKKRIPKIDCSDLDLAGI